MRSSLLSRIAGLIVASFIVIWSALPASADDFGKRFTIDLGPFLNLGTNGDANAPVPNGRAGLGYNNNQPIPVTTHLDLGLSFRIDKSTNFSYSRSYLDLAIGRVLSIPGVALVSGTISDRTDTFAISHAFGGGLSGQLYYYNHVRQDVTGLCLNQVYCSAAQLGGTAGILGNPAAIDEHGYGVHLGYNFGPLTQIGPLLTVGVDAKYIPRPGFQPPPGNPGNLDGIGHYVGSQAIFPYSISTKIPIFNDHTVIPFVGYTRDSVLFRDEATPEVYNATNFGIVKIINKDLALSIVNLNYQGCRCSSTVPGPDNIRFTVLLLKLDYRLNL